MKQPLVFAHRGVKGTHPENTMIAFYEANCVGAHGIELDVHLSKDGEVVVIHDETVDRTTNGSGLVGEHTLPQLQQLDAGGYVSEAFKGETIPTLQEVLAWLQTNELLLNIELKNDNIPYQGLEQKVIELVRRYQLESRVVLSSFNHDSIARLAKLAPDIERAILYHYPLADALGEAKARQASGLHPNFKLLTKEFVQQAQAQGYVLRPYTINHEQDISLMLDYEVDVIITDWPERVFSLLHNKGLL